LDAFFPLDSLAGVPRLLAAFLGDAFLGVALAGVLPFCGVALPPPLVCARAILHMAYDASPCEYLWSR
jgi:hypothetical protein